VDEYAASLQKIVKLEGVGEELAKTRINTRITCNTPGPCYTEQRNNY